MRDYSKGSTQQYVTTSTRLWVALLAMSCYRVPPARTPTTDAGAVKDTDAGVTTNTNTDEDTGDAGADAGAPIGNRTGSVRSARGDSELGAREESQRRKITSHGSWEFASSATAALVQLSHILLPAELGLLRSGPILRRAVVIDRTSPSPEIR